MITPDELMEIAEISNEPDGKVAAAISLSPSGDKIKIVALTREKLNAGLRQACTVIANRLNARTASSTTTKA